jgi:AbrB family looped-hinge helix DNA binding protein
MTESYHGKIGDDGRVVIPAPLRKRVGFKPGDDLVFESDGTTVTLRSFERDLRETQDYFRQFVPAGVNVIDELILERRKDADAEGNDGICHE